MATLLPLWVRTNKSSVHENSKAKTSTWRLNCTLCDEYNMQCITTRPVSCSCSQGCYGMHEMSNNTSILWEVRSWTGVFIIGHSGAYDLLPVHRRFYMPFPVTSLFSQVCVRNPHIGKTTIAVGHHDSECVVEDLLFGDTSLFRYIGCSFLCRNVNQPEDLKRKSSCFLAT